VALKSCIKTEHSFFLSSHNPLTSYAVYSENHLVTSPLSLVNFQNITSVFQVSSS